MSSDANNIQVVIAGGGPSGAATALSLAARGVKCMLAECAPSTQFKAGETIPPNALPLFRKSGIAHILDDPRHLHSFGNRIVWGSETHADKPFIFSHHPNGWHIDRAYFEQQMLDAVVNADVSVLKGTRVTECAKQANGWTVSLRGESGDLEHVNCDFIVDATGRASRLARSMGIQRTRMDHLTGITICLDVHQHQCPLYTFIEAQQNGWWYAAPLSGARMVISFMTDADLLDTAMLNKESFMRAFKATSMIKDIVADAAIKSYTAPAVQTAATSYLGKRYGQGWLAAGDAAFAYDPISSYGITSALESGFYAGHAIADTLAGTADALTAYDWLLCKAFSTYKEMHTHQYQVEKRWPEAPFWSRRG